MSVARTVRIDQHVKRQHGWNARGNIIYPGMLLASSDVHLTQGVRAEPLRSGDFVNNDPCPMGYFVALENELEGAGINDPIGDGLTTTIIPLQVMPMIIGDKFLGIVKQNSSLNMGSQVVVCSEIADAGMVCRTTDLPTGASEVHVGIAMSDPEDATSADISKRRIEIMINPTSG